MQTLIILKKNSYANFFNKNGERSIFLLGIESCDCPRSLGELPKIILLDCLHLLPSDESQGWVIGLEKKPFLLFGDWPKGIFRGDMSWGVLRSTGGRIPSNKPQWVWFAPRVRGYSK